MKRVGIGIGVLLVVAAIVVFVILRDTPVDQITVTPTKTYIALGDSVAAGVGLKNDSDSSACNRTNEAYANQAAKQLNYQLTNIACSGATLPAGILGKQEVNKLALTAQLDQLFAIKEPDLITMTVGANDAHWTEVIKKCYISVCGSNADTLAVNQDLATMQKNLQTALATIKSQYDNKEPTVLVTGYYQVFPNDDGASCTDLIGISDTELAWGRQLQSSINDAIQEVVTRNSATAKFVPVSFAEHELCTKDSWVQGLTEPQPYHPTAAGQAAIAKQVVSATRAQQ